MRPRILLSYSASCGENYERAIEAVGGCPEGGYCPTAEVHYDGLLLCGGADVDPAYFHQGNQGSVGIDPKRDAAEFALIQAFIDSRRPILVICRGLQIINVALGGSLIQDLPPHLRAFHAHTPGSDADKVHPVRAAENSFFAQSYGPLFSVNSSHHQAVDVPGEGLRPVLWSEGGVIEGMEHGSLPILCVQFHPERMAFSHRRTDTADGKPIFERFIQMCGC